MNIVTVSLERSLGDNNLVIDTSGLLENKLLKFTIQLWFSQVKTKMATNPRIDIARYRNADQLNVSFYKSARWLTSMDGVDYEICKDSLLHLWSIRHENLRLFIVRA